jgi:phosphoglycerate dehydrogenase-like enzyme
VNHLPTLRCAILDDYQHVALESADWASLAGRVRVATFHEPIEGHAALANALSDFDAIVAMRERSAFDRALLDALPRLKLLVTTGMRNASIDLRAAAELGITVCGTRGWPGTAAEHTWALILALMRDVPRENAEFHRGGRWQGGIGRSLRGATLGVVGVGNVGKQVARVGRAFDMDVVGWSPRFTDERARELGIGRAHTLAHLLSASDVVTLHVALNADTRGLVGAEALRAMKATAYLVNTSRGPVVDEAALVEALADCTIAGAAIDVFDREPLPLDHAFRRLANLIATPHVGYVTRENYRVFYGDAVDDIRAWLDGRPERVLAAPGSQPTVGARSGTGAS